MEPYADKDIYLMYQLCQDEAKFRHRYLGLRNMAIISLFVSTGLRLSELAEIRLSELDPGLKQVRVMGKGAKMRVVPIGGETRKALKHYLEIRPKGGDELWKTAEGPALTPCGIQMVVKSLQKRARVKGGGGPHRFRHYFATSYLENGGALNTLRLLLGHASLDMVLKYSRYIDIEKALAGHQQFNPDRILQGDNQKGRDELWLARLTPWLKKVYKRGERAIDLEKPTEWERAIDSEKPITYERARSHEKLSEGERGRGAKAPLPFLPQYALTLIDIAH